MEESIRQEHTFHQVHIKVLSQDAWLCVLLVFHESIHHRVGEIEGWKTDTVLVVESDIETFHVQQLRQKKPATRLPVAGLPHVDLLLGR
jgi:hypothetical protein